MFRPPNHLLCGWTINLLVDSTRSFIKKYLRIVDVLTLSSRASTTQIDSNGRQTAAEILMRKVLVK